MRDTEWQDVTQTHSLWATSRFNSSVATEVKSHLFPFPDLWEDAKMQNASVYILFVPGTVPGETSMYETDWPLGTHVLEDKPPPVRAQVIRAVMEQWTQSFWISGLHYLKRLSTQASCEYCTPS